MKRLTKHSKQTSHENGICCTHFRGPECLGVGGNCTMNCKWEEAAWSRLAAYEDTGLTPESVEAIKLHMMGKAISEITEFNGLPIDRLRELAEADKDGRVVVLPVRPVLTQSIGSMLYIVEDGEIIEDSLCEALIGMGSNGDINIFYTTLSDQISFEQADIGKTVFLTREDAKKALGGRRVDNG